MGIEVVTMEDCASNYGVFEVRGSRGDTYQVHMNGSEGPGYCTCAAFKYSGERRTCKHIEQVWKEACMFNPQWKDASESPKLRPVGYTHAGFTGGKCLCGGPMVAVKRAI